MLSQEVGSDLWLQAVWSSGPVRDLSQRGIFSQRQATSIDGEALWTEGLEGMAIYALDYLKRCGVVSRLKPQPCTLEVGGLGTRIPDFLIELQPDSHVCVLQLKAAKYLTALLQDEFRREAEFCRAHGLGHIVWTDAHPLTSGMKSTVTRLRLVRNVDPPAEDYAAFCAFVRERRAVTALDIARSGYDPALIAVAVRRLDAHIDITKALDEHTLVHAQPAFDGRLFFLGSGYDPEGWWNSLPDR